MAAYPALQLATVRAQKLLLALPLASATLPLPMHRSATARL